MSELPRGRPKKEIYINVQEFIDMINFIKTCPVDKITVSLRDEDVPIPDTGRAYWGNALEQVVECLRYIEFYTPLTSAKKKMHEKKMSQYSDDRIEIYEYIRREIIEKHTGKER